MVHDKFVYMSHFHSNLLVYRRVPLGTRVTFPENVILMNSYHPEDESNRKLWASALFEVVPEETRRLHIDTWCKDAENRVSVSCKRGLRMYDIQRAYQYLQYRQNWVTYSLESL